MTKWIFVALLGCGSNNAPPVVVERTCADAAGHLHTLVLKLKEFQNAEPAVKDRLREQFNAVGAQCKADNWPVDVRNCVGRAESPDELRACFDKLPPDLAKRAHEAYAGAEAAHPTAVVDAAVAVDPAEEEKRHVRGLMHDVQEMFLVPWAAKHPGRCPATLRETNSRVEEDPWDTKMKVVCKDKIELVSAGPDGKFDTADDIRSWE